MKKILAAILVLVFSTATFASEGEESYFDWFIDDSVKLLSSPFAGGGDWWTGAGITIGGGALLYAFDEDIRDYIDDNRNGTARALADIGETFGNGLYFLPVLGGAWAHGEFTDNQYTVDSVKLAFEAVILASLGVQIIKYTGHRKRPFKDEGAYKWGGPDFTDTSDDSFPSGHSAAAWSLAIVAAERYGDEHKWVRPVAYTLATLTPLSRMYDDKHWASDAFVGSALGYFIGKAIVSYHDEDEVAVAPALTEDGPMLQFTWNFK